MAPLIAVLDYEIGNLRSAQKALQHLGADARLTADPGLVRAADAVVLPGVGAFGRCMEAVRRVGLEPLAHEAVERRVPFLGICIGMQMLFEASEESPRATGLGILPGRVRLVPGDVKRPQMQWNRLDLCQPDDPMFVGLGQSPWVYFVHSLHGVPDDPGVVAATCEYGTTLNAAFRLDNVFATQFHPEKSASAGLALLGNFVHVAAGVPA